MPADARLAARADTFGTVFLLVQHLSRMTDEALEDWGLTTRQWLLLAVLARAFPASSPSLTEAAAVYGSSRQNVKQIVLGLESRGFLRLVPDASDGRTTRIERTGKERIFDEPDGIARSAALLDRAFGGLSDDEVDQLRSLLARWAAGISAGAA